MTLKQFTGVRLDPDLVAGLERLREDHGAPISESIRRAIRGYLEAKGVIEKADRKRASTRPRSSPVHRR